MAIAPDQRVNVRPLQESDLDVADRVLRLAFGTFVGLPDPLQMFGDSDYVYTRWRSDPASSIAAEVEGELVGSNFVANWGSVGFFGPLSVRPDLWDRGIAKRLLEATLDIFTAWGTRHAGLFTWAHSPKHLGLYQRFGFWPRFLTPILWRPLDPSQGPSPTFSQHSRSAETQRAAALEACAELTEDVFEGLDLRGEIQAVTAHALGDTLLVDDSAGLAAFAVCHVGARTEAGSGTCYVKFAAARPGPDADRRFHALLDACESFAASLGATRLAAGVNT
ncbi:MAG: GNAT family N-acetyltransferase, partial [Actinomycetota bacterium]|nr:GNAT family N-acetyltransferase [Actinomycetota bacterium]